MTCNAQTTFTYLPDPDQSTQLAELSAQCYLGDEHLGNHRANVPELGVEGYYWMNDPDKYDPPPCPANVSGVRLVSATETQYWVGQCELAADHMGDHLGHVSGVSADYIWHNEDSSKYPPWEEITEPPDPWIVAPPMAGPFIRVRPPPLP